MYVGELIKSLRIEKGMCQKDLAEDLCSPKFVYLIEKGERRPSFELLSEFFDKFGEEFHDFEPYLNFRDPYRLKTLVDRVIQLRADKNNPHLYTMTRSLQDQYPEAFEIVPWSCEVELNKAGYFMWIENQFDKCESIILENIEKLSDKNHLSYLFKWRQYNLLGECYLLQNKLDETLLIFDEIDSLISKYTLTEKNQLYFQKFYIMKMVVQLQFGHYEKVIDLGKYVLQYISDKIRDNRKCSVWFMIAISYYELGYMSASQEYLTNAVLVSLIFDGRREIEYLCKRTKLKYLIDNFAINSFLRELFLEKYRTNLGIGECQ